MHEPPEVILDSSVIISALHSSTGASAEILKLAEKGRVDVLAPRCLVKEITQVLGRKFPPAIPGFHELIENEILRPREDPARVYLSKAKGIIKDPKDAPILAFAMEAKVDYLITLDRKDFIDDPSVSKKSKLKILTPASFVKFLKSQGIN